MFEKKEVLEANIPDGQLENRTDVSVSKSKIRRIKKIDLSSFSADSLMSWILLIVTLVLPLFVWPSQGVPTQMSKTLVFIWPVLVVAVLWITGILRKGSFEFPKTWLLPSAGFVLLTYILSSFFSGAIKSALIGQGFEISTLATVGILFILFFLTSVIFTDRNKILLSQVMIFGSAAVIALYHLIRFVAVIFFHAKINFLSLGVFGDLAGNTIGKWSDLGIFFGLISIFSLLALEHFDFPKKWIKYSAMAFLAVGLFFVGVTNFLTLWYVLGSLAIISLVYAFALGYSKKVPALDNSNKLPYASLIVLAVSLVFILSNGTLGNYLSSKIKISQVDVRPTTWSATLDLSKATVMKDPVFGAGPNRFSNVWLQNKPGEVNSTVFWNTDFDYAIGFIPTLLITTGILGLLAWLIFLGLYIYYGFRMVLDRFENRLSHFLVLSSFVGSLYLWFMTIVYVPSTTAFFLTFFLSGITMAIGIREGYIAKKRVVFSDSPRKSFISVLILIIVLLGTIALAYVYGEKFIASSDYQEAMVITKTTKNMAMVESLISSATKLDPSDLYSRALSELYLNKLVEISNSINQNKDKKVSQDQVTAIQTLLRAAFQNANIAVSLDVSNYENYLTLGRVYEYAMVNGLDGSYDGATKAYNDALKLNPQSPLIYLTLARLETSKNNLDKAKTYINKSLSLKNDYSDAAYLLAQIETSQGNIKNAVSALQSAVIFSPNQPVLYFQLGLLYYNQKDYDNAISSLEAAVKLNQYYSNALYFLGLSYNKTGRTTEAVSVFEYLKRLNPDNADVESVLKSLKAPTAVSVPDKKADVPVKQKTVKNVKDR